MSLFYKGSVPTTATIRITAFANTPNEVVKTFTRYIATANSDTKINVANVDFPNGNILETSE